MGKRFTIFGNPVKHSISPKMHKFAIDGLGLDASYTRTLLENGCQLRGAFIDEFDGANVTVPFKEDAFGICDEIRGIAQDIKAVNTIINEDGNMIGYNTDAEGFYRSMMEFKDIKNALILGAGGTAKAISFILKSKGIKATILNRSKKRLEDFKDFDRFDWESFQSSSYDIIINTTSAGLNDDSLPAPKDILDDLFKNTKYAIDVIYNKDTPFLKMAKSYDLLTKDGADMLLYQGVLAFLIFYDNQFSFKEVEKHMRKAFV